MATSSPESISLIAFLLGNSSFGIYLLFNFHNTLLEIWSNWWLIIYVSWNATVFTNVYKFFTAMDAYENAVRGYILGCSFALGLILSFCEPTLAHFGWYLTALSFFHWSEYYTTAVTNPKSLSLESYLLDHSREYKAAAVASWIEYGIEWYLFPGLKQFHYISVLGLAVVIVGELIRKCSMVTASTNFNHYVQYRKQQNHRLVTHGIYSWFRHPAYVGWFVWSIGTQVILCNPVCIVGYTVASWRFFKVRIDEEEVYLLNFFGMDYVDYQQKVGTGLPFIKGCIFEGGDSGDSKEIR